MFWVTIGSNTNLHLTLIYIFSVAGGKGSISGGFGHSCILPAAVVESGMLTDGCSIIYFNFDPQACLLACFREAPSPPRGPLRCSSDELQKKAGGSGHVSGDLGVKKKKKVIRCVQRSKE